MTKYVVSKDVPQKLANNEIRIDPPSLVNEVKNCWNHRPVNGLTGPNWLRQIATEITKWDKNFHPYRHISPSEYQGIPYSSPEEVADLVLKMVTERYPNLTDAWVDYCVKTKPLFTKLIWFTGDHKQTSKFNSNGIDRIDIEEVDEYMGRKQVNKQKTKNSKESSEASNP